MTAFIFIIFAAPMAWHLVRRGSVRLPPGFVIWLLFLVWVVVGVVMVNADAPNTMPVDSKGRYLSWGLRLMGYLAVTVVMLYVGNLSEDELPRLKLMRWLGGLFVVTVIGGIAGTLFPYFSYTSPLARLLPRSVRSSDYVGTLMSPSLAQIQDVLGYESPRPMAPFEYTNAWGNNFSVLLLWFVLSWVVVASGKRRAIAVTVLIASVVPVVYSLNRGLWIGLGISAVYVSLRLAWRGRFTALLYLGGAVVVGALILAMSPLGSVIQQRLENPHSDDIRATLSQSAVNGALQSPLLGWGSPRATIGSGRGVSKGAKADCPRCGNRTIGSTGQFWLVLFSHGFVGASLYVGFFVYAVWRYRNDHSLIGIAGGLGALLPLFYMLVYNALTSPLCVYLISVALLWRNEQLRLATSRVQSTELRPARVVLV